MKNNWLIFLIFFSIFSCEKEKSNLLWNLEMGDSEELWNAKIKELLNNGMLEEIDSSYVPWSYRTFIDGVPVDVEFNDEYSNGKLRMIQFYLGGDSIYYQNSNVITNKESKTYRLPNGDEYSSVKNPTYLRRQGYRNYNDGISILNSVIRRYGRPDVLKEKIIVKKYLTSEGDTVSPFNHLHENIVDSILYNEDPEIFASWQQEKFLITLNLNCRENSALIFNDDVIELKPYKSAINNKSRLIIKALEYDSMLEETKDSLSSSYKTDDLVVVRVGTPKWDVNPIDRPYDRLLQIPLLEVSKPRNADERSIREIRIDIIIVDGFGEELCRIKDFTQSFKKNIDTGRGELFAFTGASYAKLYDIEPKSYAFEEARIYSESHDVKAKIDVKAIVFSDGTIMEK